MRSLYDMEGSCGQSTWGGPPARRTRGRTANTEHVKKKSQKRRNSITKHRNRIMCFCNVCAWERRYIYTEICVEKLRDGDRFEDLVVDGTRQAICV